MASKPVKNRRPKIPVSSKNSLSFDHVEGGSFGPSFFSQLSYRGDAEGVAETVGVPLPAAYRSKLYDIFGQIEREFEVLYAENLQLHERLEFLNEKPERESFTSEKVSTDQTDFDGAFAKHLAKTKSKPREKRKERNLIMNLGAVSGQKLKPGHRLKAQTSRIVSSFKAPSVSCSLVREFRGHRDGVWEVSTAKGGLPIIGTASADGYAYLWNVDTRRCLLQYQGHRGSVNSIRFHPNKELVLTASGDGTCHIWQAAVSAEQMRYVSSEDEVELSEKEDNWEEDPVPLSGACLRTPVCELTGHTGAVVAADWLAGGDHIISASWDRTANVYDVNTKELLHTLTGHDQELTYASAHPSQRLVVTASKDTTFRLYDFREAIHSVCVFQGHTESVTCATFTRDDKVISGSDDRSAKVWDLRNMRSPLSTIRCDAGVNKLAVSSQGLLALPLDNRNVLLYDLHGQRLARLPRTSRQGHRRLVCAASWADDAPNQKCNLFTCGFDRLVYGWSVQPGKENKE